MSISIEVDNYTVCAIPMGEIPEPTPNCEDATYELTIDGLTVDSGSIPSGENAVIPIDAFIPDCGCPDGSLIDENGDFILDENGDCISGGVVVCEDANYELTINDIVVDSGSIPSGDTQVIPIDAFIPLCEDAIVENSDTTFTQNIPSGDTYVLEDYEFEFQDENENVLATEIRPAMVGETFIVQSYCPTQFSYNLNINGVFSQVVTVDINDDININII
jgi:hypothetical protein